MFQYWLKVSDHLFHTDSLPWGNSTSLEITGLLSGVLYTFQLYLMKCEVPVLILQEVVQRTRPNLPLSLNVLRVTHSTVMINWTAPPRDSDPNSERYAYMVRVKEQSGTQVAHFNTSDSRVEIHDLKPKSAYMVSVSSLMEEMESREAFFPPIETSNLCQDFISPRGSTVVEEKMTADGPVAVIECLEGYRLISGSEIPCTPGLFLSHGPKVGIVTMMMRKDPISSSACQGFGGRRVVVKRGFLPRTLNQSDTVEEVRRDMAESSLCQKKEECFPAHATVLTSDGSRRTMAELRLRDRVLAVDAAGQFTFSEVLLWLDRQSGARERYLLPDT
ncbi:UNVERIFIED_CONTAM: hypothetical protein FKN15_009110 [Acipenser sinensis]